MPEVFRLGCPFGSKSDGDLALPSGVRLAVGLGSSSTPRCEVHWLTFSEFPLLKAKAMEGLVHGSLGSGLNYRDSGSPEETDEIGHATERFLPICIPSARLQSKWLPPSSVEATSAWLTGCLESI